VSAVILSGIVVGVLYALAGLGLVVVYRTSKVLNFAIGGTGAISAYTAFELVGRDVPYVVVMVVAILVGALAGALLEVAVARPLRQRAHLDVSLATLGALLVFEGLIALLYGSQPRSVAPAFTGAGVDLGFVALSANQLFVLALGVVAALALFGILMRTRLGLGMRAASSGPLTAEIVGIDVARTRLAGWALSGLYGGLAAVLVTPLTYLAPTSFTTFLLTAFGAVVLGGFTSIAGVVIGAMFFGVATNLLLTYLDSSLILTYTFLLVAVVLVLRPHGIFGRRERAVPEPAIPSSARAGASERRFGRILASLVAAPPKVPARFTAAGYTVLVVLLVLVPVLVDDRRVFLLATVLCTFVGVLGFNVIAGFSGQVSLGHSAFLAIGAYTAAIAVRSGVPVLLSIPLAIVGGGISGLLIGLPVTRLSGVYLSVFTLIFAFAVPELVLYFKDLTGGASGLPMSPPEALYDSGAMYWFILAVALVCAAVVLLLGRSRVGRGWRAVRDSEAGARSLGFRPAVVKLGAFTLGSALAGLAGALTGLLIGFVGAESYGVFVSIYALVAFALGGPGSVAGSFLGSLVIVALPDVTAGSPVPQDLLFGLVLIAVLLVAPHGLIGLVTNAVTVLLGRRGTPAAAAAGSGLTGGAEVVERVDVPEPLADDRPVLLRTVGLSAGYGNEDVVHDIDIDVHEGEVVALLGANGAGKSTVLRAISGVVATGRGDIQWAGRSMSQWPHHRPADVARAGIGHVSEGRGVFPDLTVRENLRLSSFSAAARPDPAGPDGLDAALDHFPILRQRLNQQAGTLSGGEQQMVAIARALLSRPRLMMLDEPSLGLSPRISQQVFEILREIAGTGVAILLVEQNARAGLRLADRGYVLSRGRVVLSGPAAALGEDASLHASYL
jgi:ABC-type branched-subunit amino acid transport system permease subunit/ABC-type branched-subunit amino acid transport system ATPase component